MCNLSQGVEERARSQEKYDTILRMYKEGLSVEQMSQISEISEDEIKKIIKDSEF